MSGSKITAGLHIVSTPIGTADDITLRALNVLRGADVLAAEDTRVLRKLMDIHGIDLNGRRILPYHDHNGDAQRPKLLAALAEGKSVAYASDAGTPLIADPGYGLSLTAIQEGHRIHASPGASAVLTALCLAGQPTDKFYFGGFLPNKSGQRIKMLESIKDYTCTLVFYESPKRSVACIQDMITVFGPDRKVSFCRELTKKFEEVVRGSLEQVHAELSTRETLKGEAVLVLGPPKIKQVTDEDINQALTLSLQNNRIKDAANEIAEMFQVPRKRAYEMALKLKDRK